MKQFQEHLRKQQIIEFLEKHFAFSSLSLVGSNILKVQFDWYLTAQVSFPVSTSNRIFLHANCKDQYTIKISIWCTL